MEARSGSETSSGTADQKDTENLPCPVLMSIKTLRQLVINNIEHYQKSKSSSGEKFFTVFCLIEQESDAVRPAVETLAAIAPRFDYDELTPGNGYRSLIGVVDCCVEKLIQISRYIAVNRDSLLFRAGHYLRELEAYSKVLSQLRVLLSYGEKLLAYSEVDKCQLFPEKDQLEQMPQDIMLEVQALDRECFYGRCLGFQFCDSIWQSLQTVAVALASYSEGYHKHEGTFSRAASSIFHGSRYLTNPEARAKQIVNVTNKSDIKFCKAFWSITEGDVIAEMCNLMAGSVAINKLIQIQPHTFELDGEDGEPVTIVPPCAHTGPGNVQIRLLSFVERDGQGWLHDVSPQGKSKGKEEIPPKSVAPISKGMLIHIHGGGFVAHTSKSHEIYLRSWARDLGVPIVSIDYSLAPEQPFPRAFEECFFAYAWALKNAQFLGSTGEHICLAGDSAGGNLSVAVAMRAASYGIRAPDGVVALYTPFNVHYQPSPSRMLSLLDPLLPIGILIRCLAAYAGLEEEFISQEVANAIVQKANDKFQVATSGKSSRGSSVRSTDSCSSQDAHQSQNVDEKPKASDADADSNTQSRSEEDEDAFLRTLEMTDAWSPDVDEGELKLPDSGIGVAISKMEKHESVTPNGNVPHGEPLDEPEPIAVVDPSVPLGSPSQRSKVIHQPKDSDGMTGDQKSTTNAVLPDNNNMTPTLKRESLTLDLGEEPVVKRGPETPSAYVTSPIRRLREVPIMKNSYMSPLFATDELLKGLPQVHIIGCTFDPLLDDSIMFARRLRSLGCPVQLEIIDKLPHGFLLFSPVGKESKAASMVCVKHIMKVLYGFDAKEEDEEFSELGSEIC
ncbi:hormone-sensitive lipase-like [Acanthaster planci]|uniref:Hormone-sensitive lipase n=1 Tax=Acanthaster planci TaxID=133434 RepID=A0A8B7ZS23_ACAPL|nr:hormone-sensitive lipase-like [Acanthaster planci]